MKDFFRKFLVLPLLGLPACSAQPESTDSAQVPDTPGSAAQETPLTTCDATHLLSPRLVRLAGSELREHLRVALPRLDADLVEAIHLQAEHLAPVTERVISSADFGAYYAAAKSAANAYAESAPEMQACRDGLIDDCTNTALRAAVTRLYRRAPSAEEWGESMTTFQTLSATHGSERAAAAVLASTLLDPQTLYQTERGEGEVKVGTHRLSNLEALSRARFALTGQAPLQAEVDALLPLEGEAFAAALGQLAASWAAEPRFLERAIDVTEVRFGMEHFSEVNRTDEAFTPEVQTAMQAEFRQYVGENFLPPTGSFQQLFAGTLPGAFPGLEAVYGTDPSVSGIDRRKGVLGLASLLSARASASGSDPVKRGLLVRIELLCEAMPPPLAGVDFSLVPVTDDMQTRERFETLASAPTCTSCHQVINPPGYLFEEFDHLGRYRTTEQGRPINATGTIPPFFNAEPYPGVGDWDGIVPLADWLSTSPEARECFAAHFSSYMVSEGIPQGTENCSLQTMVSRFLESGRLEHLVEDVVKSELFLYRTRRAL